jgi:hypothetical protein
MPDEATFFPLPAGRIFGGLSCAAPALAAAAPSPPPAGATVAPAIGRNCPAVSAGRGAAAERRGLPVPGRRHSVLTPGATVFPVRHAAVTEGAMKPFKFAAIDWNAVIQSLVLVRLGQELGTDTRLARAVHELLEAVLQTCR